MSHGITARDRQEGLSQAWHELTVIRPKLNINSNFLTEWDIVEFPLEINLGPNVVVQHGNIYSPIPWKMLVGSDDNLPIGKPFTTSYTPVKNAEFLTMIKDAISGVKGAVVESVGSVCDRSKIFVSISIKGAERYKIGDREFLDYLNFGSSHDQSTAVWANASNVCTVCANTYNANFEGNHKIKVRVKHSKDVIAKLENISEVIDSYVGSQAKFKAEFQRLMNEPMTEEQARNFYAGFVVRNTSEEDGNSVREIGPKSMKKIERLTELFVSGRGNNGDDRADCFQGGTEYYTHFSTRNNGANKGRQYYSSEFGLGNLAKQRLWNSLRNDDYLNSYMKTGSQAIKEYIAA